MEILCPKCRQKYKVPDSSTGKQAQCKNPACGQVFKIAAPAAVAPAPTPRVAQPATQPGGDSAASNLWDDLPPSPLDNLPQDAAAPTYYPSQSKYAKKKKGSGAFALKLGGGIAGMLVLVALLVAAVMKLSGGGDSGGYDGGGGSVAEAPWSLADYIPENAKIVAYADMDKLRNSALYSEIQPLVNKEAMGDNNDFDTNKISEVYMIAHGSGPNDLDMVVVRMNTDCELKDLLTEARRKQPTQSMAGYEYIEDKSPSRKKNILLAKINNRTFCITAENNMLQKTLERIGRKEQAKINLDLQKALDAVSGSSIYAVGINIENPQMQVKVDSFQGRVSVTTSLDIDLTLSFADAASAEKLKKTYDGFVAMMTMMMPPEKKKQIEPIISAIKISQADKDLHFEASWPNEVIIPMLKEGIANRGKMMN